MAIRFCSKKFTPAHLSILPNLVVIGIGLPIDKYEFRVSAKEAIDMMSRKRF